MPHLPSNRSEGSIYQTLCVWSSSTILRNAQGYTCRRGNLDALNRRPNMGASSESQRFQAMLFDWVTLNLSVGLAVLLQSSYVAIVGELQLAVLVPLIAYTVLRGHNSWSFGRRSRRCGGVVKGLFEFVWSTCLDPTIMDLDALTGEQRTALAQLEAITNGADTDTQISLLESVNWDVQVSVSPLAVLSGWC